MRLFVVLPVFFTSLFLATNASSQETNVKSSYDRLSLGFEVQRMSFTFDFDDRFSKGVSLAYAHGFPLGQRTPLFLETGAKLAWTRKVDAIRAGDHRTERTDFIHFSVPFDLVCRIGLGNDWHIAPFTGPNFRFNLMAQSSTTYGPDAYKKEKVNYLSRDILYPANVCQIGWRAGLGGGYGPFSLSYAITVDLSHFAMATGGNYGPGIGGDVRTATHTMSVGYSF